MKKFFKKYWFAIVPIIAIPLVLIGTYFWFIPHGIFTTGDHLEKNDWLSFWGGFLSFGGSLFLGAISIWQNNQANETNQKMLTETQKMNQAVFENDLKRNKYVSIIAGIQQVISRIDNITEKLININIELIKKTDTQFREEYAARLFDPILKDIVFLRDLEIDSCIPTNYDSEFSIIKESRKEIKQALVDLENQMKEHQQEFRIGRKEKSHIDITYNRTKGILIDMISYFNQKLGTVESYISFIGEDAQ